MSDGAWNTVLCRMEAIHEQSEKVRVIAAGLLSHTLHGVPGDIERMEAADKEVATLHSLVCSTLHAVREKAGAQPRLHSERWIDKDGALPPVHHIVLGGHRREDPPKPLTLTFSLAEKLERA